MTYSFIYFYDNLKNCFKISTDITSYTVSEMTWDFIEEYQIYNLVLKEVATVKICKDPLTGQEYTEETPLEGRIPRTFDVSKFGEYVSTFISFISCSWACPESRNRSLRCMNGWGLIRGSSELTRNRRFACSLTNKSGICGLGSAPCGYTTRKLARARTMVKKNLSKSLRTFKLLKKKFKAKSTPSMSIKRLWRIPWDLEPSWKIS